MSTVLVIDDEVDILDGMRIVLSLEGYDVITASSGEEALRLVTEDPPNLIISDIMMPDMTGLEMCRRLRRDAATRDIPIILNSSVDPGTPVEQNWDVFLRKPLDFRRLLIEIENLLARP